MYNTIYRYRAYVKTATETTYGEEQNFTTGENPNGIVEHVMTKDRIEIDAPIYNLQGIRMKDKENLSAGIYIQGGKKFVIKYPHYKLHILTFNSVPEPGLFGSGTELNVNKGRYFVLNLHD